MTTTVRPSLLKTLPDAFWQSRSPQRRIQTCRAEALPLFLHGVGFICQSIERALYFANSSGVVRRLASPDKLFFMFSSLSAIAVATYCDGAGRNPTQELTREILR
jgi:hypothetical protein